MTSDQEDAFCEKYIKNQYSKCDDSTCNQRGKCPISIFYSKKLFDDCGIESEILEFGGETVSYSFFDYTKGYYDAANLLVDCCLNVMKDTTTPEQKYEIKRAVLDKAIELRNADASKILVDRIIELAFSNDNKLAVETLIYPICFLYRHYIELNLKYIYSEYSGEDNGEVSKRFGQIGNAGHSLVDIWELVKPILEPHVLEIDQKSYEYYDKFIREFEIMDGGSFRFRYPVTKGLAPSIDKKVKVNIRNLKLRMKELENFIVFIHPTLDIKKRFDEIEGLLERARSHLESNNLKSSLTYIKQAEEKAESWHGKPHKIFLEIETMKAFAFSEMGVVHKKEEHYQNVLSLSEELGVAEYKRIALYELGIIKFIQKDYSNCLQHHLKLLEIRAGMSELQIAQVCECATKCHFELGELQKAKEKILEAKSIFTKIGKVEKIKELDIRVKRIEDELASR